MPTVSGSRVLIKPYKGCLTADTQLYRITNAVTTYTDTTIALVYHLKLFATTVTIRQRIESESSNEITHQPHKRTQLCDT
jgi:hypothetical protein